MEENPFGDVKTLKKLRKSMYQFLKSYLRYTDDIEFDDEYFSAGFLGKIEMLQILEGRIKGAARWEKEHSNSP